MGDYFLVIIDEKQKKAQKICMKGQGHVDG